MKLMEFLDKEDIKGAYYDPENDKINVRNPGDSRKPKITLKVLNRLKKIRALRRLENLKREDVLGIMYGEPAADAGGGFGGGAPSF